MFLDYLALVLLIMGLTLVFYGFIYIHDLPHKIAKERDHPHEEAIHVACWLSLFTLHAIWPLVFIWAVSHKKHAHEPSAGGLVPGVNGDLTNRIAVLEQRLAKLETR
jgi:hypothetical protein